GRRASRRRARARQERRLRWTHEIGEIAQLLIEIHEEEQLVRLQRAARADAELLPPLVRAIDARGEERILRRELVITQEVEPFTAESIRPGFRDGIDGAAGGASKLCREVAHADLEFLDRGLA